MFSLLRRINFVIQDVMRLRRLFSLNYVFVYNFHRHLPKVFSSVQLPNKIKVYVNNDATLSINIPDMYESKEYFLYEEFVPRKDWIVIDVGAYVGIFSLEASRAAGDGGLIISFEPNPLAYYWLINNVRLNKARNITALPFALGDSVGEKQLFVAKENIEASSFIIEHVLHNPAEKYSITAKFNVPIITLDQFLEKKAQFSNKPIMNVDLVKIDVEGYELRVLRGAEKVLKQGTIRRLVIEVHKDQVPTEEIIRYLKECGFHIIRTKQFGIVKDIVYAKYQ